MNEGLIAGLIFLLTLAFGAGLYVMALRVATKQINGLGKRVNRVVAAVIHICPEGKREEITTLMLGLTDDKRK